MKLWKLTFVATLALVLIIPLTAYAAVSMFADVPDNHIFVDDINWMKTAGVTNGCGDGTTYCPEANVTRGQMAAFMHRLATGRSVDAGTLDGKDSDDYIYNTEWVTDTVTWYNQTPGATTVLEVDCPRGKYVISGGGMAGYTQLAMTLSRPADDGESWMVWWRNFGTTTVDATVTGWALCAGPGLRALPSP